MELERAPVRTHAIEADRVVPGRVIPAAEQHLAGRKHERVEIVTLVERELPDVVAFGAHHVQHEGLLVAVLVERSVLRLALVEQNCLRLALPGRGEDDASVGQIVRCDVVTGLGGDVGGDHTTQSIGVARVFPDVPRRLLVIVDVLEQRLAQREQQPHAVVGHLDITHVALAAGDPKRQIPIGRARRGAVAQPQIAACVETDLLAQVGLDQRAVLLSRQRTLRVGDREVDHDRVRILTVGKADGAAAVAAAATRCEQEKTHPGERARSDTTSAELVTDQDQRNPLEQRRTPPGRPPAAGANVT